MDVEYADLSDVVATGVEDTMASDAASSSDKQLFVRNLSYATTEEDLTKIFEEHGPLKNVSIVKDTTGSSRGFGFVKFALDSDALNAFQRVNNHEVQGACHDAGICEEDGALVEEERKAHTHTHTHHLFHIRTSY